MSETVLKGFKCDRKQCGHSWVARTEKIPICCPKCKSPYWQKRDTKVEIKKEK